MGLNRFVSHRSCDLNIAALKEKGDMLVIPIVTDCIRHNLSRLYFREKEFTIPEQKRPGRCTDHVKFMAYPEELSIDQYRCDGRKCRPKSR